MDSLTTQNTTDVATKQVQVFQTVDLQSGKIPDLESADVYPVDLVSEYYTPEKDGEKKRAVFFKIDDATTVDQQTGEEIDLECVFLAVPDENGNAKIIRNGSKQLVGTFNEAVRQGRIVAGSPVEITYKGMVKNRSNQNRHASWSVVPLILSIS